MTRDDGTLDDLVDRIPVIGPPEDVEAMAGFSDEGIEEHMQATHDEFSDSLEANSRR